MVQGNYCRAKLVSLIYHYLQSFGTEQEYSKVQLNRLELCLVFVVSQKSKPSYSVEPSRFHVSSRSFRIKLWLAMITLNDSKGNAMEFSSHSSLNELDRQVYQRIFGKIFGKDINRIQILTQNINDLTGTSY